MPTADASGEWQAVQDALERYFMAREQGEAVDIKAACHGDEALTERVLAVLGEAPDLVVESGEPTATADTLSSFGDFDVVEQIGKGGMGTVYLAMQRSLGRQVALKVMDRAAADVPSARLRMRREAELTAHLNHPNIVPVYAVGEVGDVPFIAMKYLLGPSLAEVERPWPPERVAEIGIALAEALDTAHVNGVVHRDVKPANILLDGNTPVFVDFGLARAQSDPTLTQEGKVAGTLRYMAPERLDAATPVLDPRVDIYGLGATLYELLAGREVFAEQTPTALVRSVLARDPAPLKLSGRAHDLETIVLRALAKEPSRRFPTARAMADDLRRFAQGEPVKSRRMSAVARGWRQVQRYPRTSALVATAALLVLVSAVILFVQAGNEQADRRRQLEAARADFLDHRYERSQQLLQLLQQRHPGDVEIGSWLVRAGMEVAIDRLLIAVTSRTANVDAEIVKGLITAVDDAVVPVESTPVAGLAAIIALDQSGERERARTRLQKLPPAMAERRTARALSAWLAEAPLPWSMPPMPERASADEAMLAGLLLRLAGASPGRVLEELQAIEAEQRGAQRALFLEAIVRMDLGQLSEAHDLLRGLARDEAPVSIWRVLADVQMQLGRLDEAAVSLHEARDDHSPSADYQRLQHEFATAQRRGDRDTCTRLVADLRSAADRNPETERFLAEYDGKSDAAAVPDVIARLEGQLASDQLDHIGRDLVLAALVEVSAWHLPRPGEADAGAEAAGLHRRLVVDWAERAATIQHRPARIAANLWLARSMCLSGVPGDLWRGLELFRDTCLAFPGRWRLTQEYALAVTALPGDTPALIRTNYAIAARQAVDAVLQRVDRGDLVLRAGLAGELRECGWLLAWHAGDVVEMARRLPAIEAGLRASMFERARRQMERGQEALEQFSKK